MELQRLGQVLYFQPQIQNLRGFGDRRYPAAAKPFCTNGGSALKEFGSDTRSEATKGGNGAKRNGKAPHPNHLQADSF
jgi:hypothetical protein